MAKKKSSKQAARPKSAPKKTVKKPAAKKKPLKRPALGRPTITAEEKLFMLFHEDYEARQVFEFLAGEVAFLQLGGEKLQDVLPRDAQRADPAIRLPVVAGKAAAGAVQDAEAHPRRAGHAGRTG